MTLTEEQRSRHLDRAVAEWNAAGWLIVARSPSAVQLRHPRRPLLPLLLIGYVVAVAISIGLSMVLDSMQAAFGAAAVFVFTTVLVVSAWVSMPDRLLYLVIGPDGSVQES